MSTKNLPILVLLSVLSFSGCMGIEKSRNAPMARQASTNTLGGGGVTGLQAFQTSFHDFAKQNCLPCHGATGSQSQHFADSDVNSAYAIAKGYVNFSDPAKSLLVKKSDDGHCSQSSCSGKGQEALSELQTWASAELAAQAAAPTPGSTGGGSSGVLPKYLTAPMTLPSSLPNMLATAPSTYTVMRWPLSGLTPANSLVTNALFELEIQLISPTSYRLRNPRIVGASSPIQVTGIHLLTRQNGASGAGSEDPYGKGWNTLVATAAAVSMPNPMPTGPITAATPLSTITNILSVLNANSPPDDQITLGFDDLKLGSTTPPPVATFSAINTNILQPRCVGCHKPGKTDGGVDLASYTAVLNSVVKGNPAASALYTSVSGTSPSMPPGGTKLSTGERKLIFDWITNSAPNN